MREIEHHLDAIQAGVEGALEDYERSDPGRFFKPEAPRPRRRHDGPDRETLDHEVGLAELTALAGEEIDVTAHPEGELLVGEEAELLAEMEGLDPHLLAAAIEVARLAADEFGNED